MQDDYIIRQAEACNITGLSKTTIWRMEKKGDFPKRIKLGSNSIGWLKSEIYQWIDSRRNPNLKNEVSDAKD